MPDPHAGAAEARPATISDRTGAELQNTAGVNQLLDEALGEYPHIAKAELTGAVGARTQAAIALVSEARAPGRKTLSPDLASAIAWLLRLGMAPRSQRPNQ